MAIEWGPVIGAAVAMVGGMIQLHNSNIRGNKAADKQMAFQARMSNTAHQREVADLQAAGLNPSLSAGGNGSSTPGGSQADTAPPIDMPTILNMFMSQQQLRNDAARIDIESRRTEAGIQQTLSKTDLNKMDKRLKQKGMIRADVEGEGAQILKGIMRDLKKSSLMNQNPNPTKNIDKTIKQWQQDFGTSSGGVLP